MVPDSPNPLGQYGQDYVAWKNWGGAVPAGTSKCSPYDSRYYSMEIAKTGLRRISDVLEIGFGDGVFLAYARERGWTVAGTEVNEVLVAQAQQAGFAVKLTRDASAYPSASFDLVVAFDVLEHIPQEQLPDFLRHIRDKLREGGVLLARFPNGDSSFGLAHQNADITHVTTIGSGKIEYLTKMCGFSLICIGPESQPIFGGGVGRSCYRLLATPVRALIELLTKLIYFPRTRLVLFSANMVVALQKPVVGAERQVSS
jgi:SAM-dependent methyltransferase